MAVLSILQGATRWRGGRRLWLLGVICLALLMLGGCGVFKKKQDGEMTLVQMRFFGSYNDRLIMGYHQKKARGWDVCGLASYDLAKQEVLQVYPSAEGYCMETPAVSYDNEWIAFGYYQQGRDDYLEQIGIMRADGSDWRLLTDTDSYKAHPSFSADGKKLIFLSARSKQRSGRKTMVQSLDAWEVEVGSGKLTQLTNISAYSMQPPMYVANGDRFVISPDISYSFPVKYSHTKVVKLDDKTGRGETYYLVDGDFIDIVDLHAAEKKAGVPNKAKHGRNSVYLLDYRGDQSSKQEHDFSEPLFNVYKGGNIGYYARSANIDKSGESLLFVSGDLFAKKDDLFIYNISEQEITQLTDNAYNVGAGLRDQISADGSMVFYSLLVQEQRHNYIQGELSTLAPGKYYRLMDVASKKDIMEVDMSNVIAQIKGEL